MTITIFLYVILLFLEKGASEFLFELQSADPCQKSPDKRETSKVNCCGETQLSRLTGRWIVTPERVAGSNLCASDITHPRECYQVLLQYSWGCLKIGTESCNSRALVARCVSLIASQWPLPYDPLFLHVKSIPVGWEKYHYCYIRELMFLGRKER